MDDIDLEIISQLKADGRTTFKALGKITGYTSRASRREEKLRDSSNRRVFPMNFSLATAGGRILDENH